MSKRWAAFFLSLCMLTLGGCAQVPAQEENAPKTTLTVHVLNVGKADCILVNSGDRWMLVDAGLNGTQDEVLDYLQQQGAEKLDCAVGTHPDKDHIGGLDAVLESVPTAALFIPPLEVDSKPYRNMLEAAEAQKVPVQHITAGASWKLGETTVKVLAPGATALATKDENESSIVLMLEHGGFRMLLMADAQYVSENEMIDQGTDLKADVIKVGHHGSDEATGTALLQAVSPKAAIISTGEKEGETLPHPRLLARLEQFKVTVYRTDLDGTILVRSDGVSYEISTDSNAA